MVFHCPDVRQLQLSASDGPLGGDGGFEPASWGRERGGHGLPGARPAQCRHHRRGGRRQHAGQPQWAGGEIHQPIGGDLKLIRPTGAIYRVGWRGVWFAAAQPCQQISGQNSVHGGVVGLRHHRQVPAVVCGVGPALHHPHLPQWFAAVQGLGGDATADFGQFALPATRRQADAFQMPLDVEVGVLHPDRVVQIESAICQLCPQLGQRLDSQLQPRSKV
jgi:hypothetical protein